MDFVSAHPELVSWTLIAAAGLVSSLVVYIWQDHRGREREDRDGLRAAFDTAINKLEESIRSLNGTVRTLGGSVGKRIDDIEDRQATLAMDLATERQRINGVIAVCRERARHCGVLGGDQTHYHRRAHDSGEASHCHLRALVDHEKDDGGHDED